MDYVEWKPLCCVFRCWCLGSSSSLVGVVVLGVVLGGVVVLNDRSVRSTATIVDTDSTLPGKVRTMAVSCDGPLETEVGNGNDDAMNLALAERVGLILMVVSWRSAAPQDIVP